MKEFYDPNENVPNEPPPSYDDAIADPTIPDTPLPPQRPQGSPPSQNRPPQSIPSKENSYSRPNIPPPNHQGSSNSQQLNLPKPTPINPNPYLPWRYPSNYNCKKCENTGFRKKDGTYCKSCWKKFRPQNKNPPKNQKELEYLATHKPKPIPIHSNVVKLPEGARANIPYNPFPQQIQQAPVVVNPGDPRIGGVLCPRCKGRGLVHFFLDLERCSQCNGLGRVGSNGRPL